MIDRCKLCFDKGDEYVRYDTKNSLTWTQKLSDQLNVAHVARKK